MFVRLCSVAPAFGGTSMVCHVVVGVDVKLYLTLILMIDEVDIDVYVHVHVHFGVGVGVGCTLPNTAVTCWVCFPFYSTSK